MGPRKKISLSLFFSLLDSFLGHASDLRFYYPPNVQMDTARLPAYRSSYLLRFHPYPRVKPSARERIVASTREDGSYQPLQMDTLLLERDIPSTLNQAIHGSDIHTHVCSRRLSVSSLVVDLAFLFAKKASPPDN
ncbi:hypothetical protein EV363DRAFT_1158820 [Boletus edulis]|nr:hypothetical protein EV363DRAFT_1158820 [Boletus edulis]